jgi:16S rRNA (adenine1518-N6/adenine1519-N6)-dimethyltransferase
MRTQAKKRFGQHFLRDRGILDRIVKIIRPDPDDLIVEIGAGDGAMTTRLAPLVRRLVAIEIDRDCIPLLQSAVAGFPSVTILRENFLQSDLDPTLRGFQGASRRLRFVGNLPYNIATAIIDRLLNSGLAIADLVFMVQLEVAERILAPPGSRDYGYFSIFCQHRADVRFEFKVAPACFVPRPKVMSAVISLFPKPVGLSADQEDRFIRVTKAAFAHRRKTLSNSLRSDPEFGPVAEEILGRAAIDGARRPEQLSVAEYERLSAVVLTGA